MARKTSPGGVRYILKGMPPDKFTPAWIPQIPLEWASLWGSLHQKFKPNYQPVHMYTLNSPIKLGYLVSKKWGIPGKSAKIKVKAFEGGYFLRSTKEKVFFFSTVDSKWFCQIVWFSPNLKKKNPAFLPFKTCDFDIFNFCNKEKGIKFWFWDFFGPHFDLGQICDRGKSIRQQIFTNFPANFDVCLGEGKS